MPFVIIVLSKNKSKGLNIVKEKTSLLEKIKSLCILFLSMFKIGLFTFGGGYAMIHLLENEFVSKKKWLDNEEFMDLVTIAESTPGPVAINCSTYIGYKTHKFIGSFIATLAMCLPSFIIIFVISLFFDQFLSIKLISAAFRGIQACAIFLIFCAGIKLGKKMKWNIFNILVAAGTLISMVLISLFNVNFSSIFYILIAGALGLFIYSIGYFKSKIKDSKNSKTNTESAEKLENNESTEIAEEENTTEAVQNIEDNAEIEDGNSPINTEENNTENFEIGENSSPLNIENNEKQNPLTETIDEEVEK